MHWKRFLLTGVVIILTLNQGAAKERAKPPRYYKSSISSRFVKFNSNSRFQTSDISPVETSSLRAEIPGMLNVLAIRVQFQLDNDRSTTGNGWFDLSQPDTIMINPPPHDYHYFSNQLKALKDYYEKVSGGKLILNIDDGEGNYFVYPQQNDSVWTLPHPMTYYNPNTTEDALDRGLAELFRDAIQIADQNSDIDFSQFDVFIIFHAGVGWEFTQDFDTTPSDIPSVFLNLNDLKKTIGNNSPDFPGIAVNDGACFIKEGIILPETENQGGYEFFGLLGTAAIMFGHQLGLPNLFDTDSGRPGIGRFGLMDQGSGSYSGLIPVYPCAWSKIFLGWEEPIVITSGQKVPVAASLTKNPHKIYKIPINAREYFLIENRQRAVLKARSIAVGHDEYGTRIEFNDEGEINPSANNLGVIVEIDEYDFGLPGSGIVIWHIDESVIEQRYAENRVNVDIHHRGVDVVEADGAQDIGYFFNFFGITGFESGSAYDMWWDNNEDHLWANDSDTVRFTPTTMPNSNAYSGANSGIYITEFSPRDSVMYFSLEIKQYLSGFPVFLGLNSGMKPISIGDLDGDGKSEFVTANESGQILTLKANGEKYIDNSDQTFFIKVNGDTTLLPLAVFAAVKDDQFLYPPTLADLDEDGKLEVFAGSNKGKLWGWKPIDEDNDGRADELFQIDFQSPITTVVVAGDFIQEEAGKEIFVGLANGNVCLINRNGNIIFNHNITQSVITGISGFEGTGNEGIVLVTKTGEVFRLDKNGQVVWERSFPDAGEFNYPALADVNNDEAFEIILSSRSGRLYILNHDGDLIPEFRSVSVNCPLSNPTVADIDHNGYLDVVLSGGGKIFAYNYTGAAVSNFPMEIDRNRETEAYPDPIIADIDGDDLPEIFLASTDNKLYAINYLGEKPAGFPLSISGSASAQLTIGTLQNDRFVLVARTGDDYSYAWELPFNFDAGRISWGGFLRNGEHNAIYSEEVVKPSLTEKLMPENTVYNYPNPAEGNSTFIRYYLSKQANVSIRIYDMAGELVEQITGTGYPEIDNEVTWDISDVQSGVYLARIKAESENETNVVIIKIAVVK